MKGILIDVLNKEIREVEVNETDKLHSMYELIGCQWVDRVRLTKSDDVWVDDEGLLTMDEDSKFFLLKDYPQPLCGNGLVLGNTPMGESVSPNISVDELKGMVTFMSMEEVIEYSSTR